MQKHSYYLAKYFARQGVHVDLYHMNESNYDINKLEFFSEEEKKNISSFVFTFPNKGKWPWHYLQESYLHSKEMYETFVKQQPVDFIYSKGYTGWYFIKQKKKGAKLPPIGLRLHGYEIFQQGSSLITLYRNLLYLPLIKYLNNNADIIYSYGGGITDIIKNNLPKIKGKIVEVSAAIEYDWVYDKNTTISTPIKFTFLGRYDIRKGINELNAALKSIVSKLDLEFHFIGPIPEENKITSKKIIYHGVINEAEKIKTILRETDVFVLPSHSEGMPNVILEAMASGCAILATNVGAINVMVDESNGWLIPPINAKAIEEKILEIISIKKDVLLDKKAKSVEKIKRLFLWEEIIKKEIERIQKNTIE
jgi:glycosyltransferase involved in cell wall biosynthesis